MQLQPEPQDAPDPLYGTRQQVYLEPAEYSRYLWEHRQELFTPAELDVREWKIRLLRSQRPPITDDAATRAYAIAREDWPGFSARAVARVRDAHAADLGVQRCPMGHVRRAPDDAACAWCEA